MFGNLNVHGNLKELNNNENKTTHENPWDVAQQYLGGNGQP